MIAKKKDMNNNSFLPFFSKTTIPDSNLNPKLESLETQGCYDKNDKCWHNWQSTNQVVQGQKKTFLNDFY